MPIFYALIALCLSGSSLAQIITSGRCPDMETQQNFNMTKVIGRWYEQGRYKTLFEIGTKCGTFDFLPASENSGKLINTGVAIRQGTERRFESKVVIPNPEVPAKLLVKIPLSPVEGDNNLWVVATDYVNWGIFSSCNIIGNRNVQYLWVVTRMQNPDNSVLSTARSVLLRNNVDTSLLEMVEQKKCRP